MVSETCLVKVGDEHGNGGCLVGFQEFATNQTGLRENLIQSKIDEAHEIVDESHGRPDSERFSRLIPMSL